MAMSIVTSALALALSAAPAAAACPEANPIYTDACGPTFVVPSWADAGGWTDPSQYQTIQLAPLEGNGRDQLFARTSAGIEVWYFDTTLGQWRPEVDSSDKATLLTQFANPAPLSDVHPNPPKTDWTLPQYYQTIQAANIDGGTGEEILARSADGMIVFKFTPGASPGVGTWKQLTTSGPFPDSGGWDKPQYYRTIQTGDIEGDGKADLVGRGRNGLEAYRWTGSSWQQLPGIPTLGDKEGFDQEQYYSSIQLGNLDGNPQHAEDLIARTQGGLIAWKFTGNGWRVMNDFSHPFTDVKQQADCPFTTSSDACFGSGPEYYSTIKLADVDGNGRDEVIGRASDGLRVLRYQGNTPDAWGRLATLTALSDANGFDKPQYYRTIQFADLLGTGQDEAIARDKNGIVVWQYDSASQSWKQLPANPSLDLADDPWGSDPSYYGTILTGDITGSGHAAVVARGPYGIRTWFYSGSGWSSYLPQGPASYPQFTSDPGEAAAFSEITTLAIADNVIPKGSSSVRVVWTGGTAPQDVDLTNLQSGILSFADCTGLQPGNPPQYANCKSPTASISDTDWTFVLNELFAEIYAAREVVAFFSQLDALRQNIFFVKSVTLPALGSDLHLDGAADNETTVDMKGIFATIFALAGAVAGETPGLGTALEIASELLSALPTASTTANSKFPAKYSELQGKLATAAQEAIYTLAANSQEVRGNYQLLTLVSQLRTRGTWNLDSQGVLSSTAQGFVEWVYKQLLPTLYVRYKITTCRDETGGLCSFPDSSLPGVVGDAQNFQMIGPHPVFGGGFGNSTPCWLVPPGSDRNPYACKFTALSSDIANSVWGLVKGTCVYQPGNDNTGWVYKACNLGVDPKTSVDLARGEQEGWNFTNYCGNPSVADDRFHFCSEATGNATVGSGARVTLSGKVDLPTGFTVRSATLPAGRILDALPVSDELVDRQSGQPLGTVTLGLSGGVLRSDTVARPLAQLHVRSLGNGQAAVTLNLRRAEIGVPYPCQELPAADAPPFELTTSIRLRDGARVDTIALNGYWHCIWNQVGAVTALRPLAPAPGIPHRPGLAISISGPRTAVPGETVTYVVHVRNRRKAAHNPAVSSLWHVLVQASEVPAGAVGTAGLVGRARSRSWGIAVLRRGASLSVRFRIRAPTSGTFCVEAVAQADAARAVGARLCDPKRASPVTARKTSAAGAAVARIDSEPRAWR